MGREFTCNCSTTRDPRRTTHDYIARQRWYNVIAVLNYLDWELSPEQRMIQGVVREFVEHEALPVIPEYFEQGEFPRQLIPRLGELGVLGPTLPQYGSGLDYTRYRLICQELERRDSCLRS